MCRLQVTAWQCKTCNYVAERFRPECKGHQLTRLSATKRWWQCLHCSHKFSTVGVRLPKERCPRSGCEPLLLLCELPLVRPDGPLTENGFAWLAGHLTGVALGAALAGCCSVPACQPCWAVYSLPLAGCTLRFGGSASQRTVHHLAAGAQGAPAET